MPKIDFDTINALCSNQGQLLVERWIPGGSYIDGEYAPLNPTRGDKTAGSFRVNTSTGAFIDFATGDKGKDFVALYAYINNLSMGDAAKQVKIHIGLEEGVVPINSIPAPQAAKPVTKNDRPQPVIPAPNEAPEAIVNRFGVPTYVFKYLGSDGGLIGYVLRYDLPEGKKTIKPLFWFGDRQWQWRGISGDNPRPIYGLDRLTERPTAPVLVVEGEKSADMGQQLLPEYVVVSWLGGTSMAKRVQWGALMGRKVTIWPDNDDPGRKAANEIKKHVPHAYIATPLQDKPPGWDVADATTDEAYKVLSPPPVIPQDKPKNDVVNNEYFRCVGFVSLEYRSLFIFYSKIRKNIFALRSNQIVWENLQELAPGQFWEYQFPGHDSKKQRVDAVRERLIFECSTLGVYNPDKVRGRGAWMESESVVVHLGDRLLIDGKEIDLADHNSDHVYQQAGRIRVVGEPLAALDGFKFVDLCSQFNWQTQISGFLLAGWIFLAPVCGALRWRPHVWITGLAGTGKSWIFEFIIQAALGDFGLKVQSETTEAGLRQRLGCDALPVVFDEAESENHRSDQRIQNVMGLMRQASSDSSGAIIKGSAGGIAQSYSIRSMFAFASILPGLTQSSDRTRVTVLNLRQLNHGEASAKHFAEVKSARKEIYNPDFLAALRMRAIAMLPEIRESVKIFSEVAADKIGNKRLGDQIGTLLAGAWIAFNDEIPTRQQAEALISDDDWDEEKNLKEETDYHRMLDYLFQQTIRTAAINSSYGDVSVGELLADAIKRQKSTMLPTHPDTNAEGINRELARIGIRAKDNIVYIQNNNSKMQALLRDTAWAKNWKNLLLAIPGAEKAATPIRFGFGFQKARCVQIPVESLPVQYENSDTLSPEDPPPKDAF